MRKQRRIMIGVVASMLVWFSGTYALDIQEGQYEITFKSEMKGMPISMPATTVKQCITQKDPVPSQSAAGQECRITDMKTEGNTVTWAMECTQQGNSMQATGSMTFQGDRFEGETEMKMGPQAGNMVLITRMPGMRIGECEK